MRYTYKCKYRPPMPGSVPRGFVRFTDGDKSVDDHWGTVTYNRKLTEKEIQEYELEKMRV